jgi:NADH dehydrogenase FAD-containing subunit
MTDQSGRRRVVIVGGGFAGLFAARRLKRSTVSVTLIDRAQHCYENVDCVMAEVVDFDAAGRRVIATRVGGDRIEFGYDDLIVAAGVRQSVLTWWLAFTRDVRRERTFTTQQIQTMRDVYTHPPGPDSS